MQHNSQAHISPSLPPVPMGVPWLWDAAGRWHSSLPLDISWCSSHSALTAGSLGHAGAQGLGISSLSPFVPTSPVTASWSCPPYLRRKPRSSSPKESSPRSCRRARSTCATPRSQSEASVCPSVLPGCPSLPEPSSRPSDTAQPQPGPSHCSTKPALLSLSPPHPLRTKPRVFSCLQG